jgi:hypothetical protein
MKKQSFIAAFALVLLSVFVFSCAQDEILPAPAETAAVQNEVTIDPSKAFPLPAEIQQLSEEEVVEYIKTLKKEDLDKMAADYAAGNPVEERSAWYECIICSLSRPPVYPIEWSVPGYFILVYPSGHYILHGCNYCNNTHQYIAIAL